MVVMWRAKEEVGAVRCGVWARGSEGGCVLLVVSWCGRGGWSWGPHARGGWKVQAWGSLTVHVVFVVCVGIKVAVRVLVCVWMWMCVWVWVWLRVQV
jgi:hypothetical protein